MTDTLDFGFSRRASEARKCLIKHLKECVGEIGVEGAVEVSGARRQDLSDALADREGRRLEVEWCIAIAAASPEHLRAKVAECLVKVLGYGIAPLKPLTAEEKLARLEYRVAKRFGEAGAEIVEENRR